MTKYGVEKMLDDSLVSLQKECELFCGDESTEPLTHAEAINICKSIYATFYDFEKTILECFPR